MSETSAFSQLETLIGEELAAEIREHFGGESIYVPKRPTVEPEALRREFEVSRVLTTSVESALERVGRRHGLSSRTVRRKIVTISS